MNDLPEVTSVETIQRRSAYQSMQEVTRPPYWGIDRDPSRRPGNPMVRKDPRPLPNTHFPPEQQQGEPTAPRHGRPNKPMPPVFGTAIPLRGLSGAIRKLAYRYPDHYPRHWLLKLLGDRVDSWEHHWRRYSLVALPLVVAAMAMSRASRRRRRSSSLLGMLRG